METAPPASLNEATVLAALRAGWHLEGRALTYVPKGAGAYHWRVETDDGARFVSVDDLDAKPWISRDRSVAGAGLAAAYAAARTLRDDGLAFVVAPLPTVEGSIVVRLDGRHVLAVLPWVAGAAGTWGAPLGDEDRAALLTALARLHEPARVLGIDLDRRRRTVPERAALLDALDDLAGPWAGGPLAEDARAALATHAEDLRRRLARFDALAAELDRRDPPVVVTHGEPHPGNLLATPDGLRLLDWDTVALAEPERDHWMLDTGPGALDAYVEATGRPADPAALELWRLGWTLSDLAWLTQAFRQGGDRAADPHWPTYVGLLEGGSAAPYGVR
jgi:spectinomycin phosphotransferase